MSTPLAFPSEPCSTRLSRSILFCPCQASTFIVSGLLERSSSSCHCVRSDVGATISVAQGPVAGADEASADLAASARGRKVLSRHYVAVQSAFDPEKVKLLTSRFFLFHSSKSSRLILAMRLCTS